MILKVLILAAFLLLEVSLVRGQWYGGYDCGQYSQRYIIVNPYGSYDDIYSQYSSYPYNDPQFYSGYTQTPQYAQQPIVVVVNNDRSDCDVDDILSLIFPMEEKRKEPVYVPVPIVMENRDVCECKCECRCECSRSDYCPHCDSPKNRCKCKEDCQCKKKEKNQKPKCKCNECQKHESGCGCGGSIFHKMF